MTLAAIQFLAPLEFAFNRVADELGHSVLPDQSLNPFDCFERKTNDRGLNLQRGAPHGKYSSEKAISLIESINDIAYIGNGSELNRRTAVVPYKTEWNQRNFVYRYFDADGNLLYIGTTANAEARYRHHASKSVWFREIANSTYEQFDTRTEALAAEKAAIEAERPLHNKIWNNQSTSRLAQISKRI